MTRLSNIGFVWDESQHASSSTGSMIDSNSWRLQRNLATPAPQYSVPAQQHLASSLPSHLLQAQLDSLLPLAGFSQTQRHTLSPNINAFLASEAVAEASRREGILRQALARRNEPLQLYSGEFASTASLGPLAASSGLSSLAAQNTLLEQIVLQQALQDLRSHSSAGSANAQTFPFASRSLHGALPYAPAYPTQSSLVDTITSINLHHLRSLRAPFGPTSFLGSTSTLAPAAPVRRDKRNDAEDDREEKDP